MQARAFAERLLFGDTLDDKLSRPGPLVDDERGAPVGVVDMPGRPLGLVPRKGGRFPTATELATDTGRGRALHAFANHELLAIEIMALALLRFPDAEPDFRTDLIRTIAEEQRHLRKYIRRMEQLGVQLGDVPVNGWFWSHLASMESPTDYVARMSLLFEQANLDFAGWYRDRFRELGDSVTADILDSVYEDEIRHVAVGARWFGRWRDQTVSPFKAWSALLPHPLGPVRARGLGFDRAARQRAGLDPAWIDGVESAVGSKGRQPVLWLPELDAEHHLQGLTTLPRAARQLVADLEPAVAWLAHPLDVVAVTRPPSPAFLEHLAQVGRQPAQLVEHDALPHHTPFASVDGWARTDRLRTFAATHDTATESPTPVDQFAKRSIIPVHAAARAAGIRITPASQDPRPLERGDRMVTPTLFKPDFGSSGRGQRDLSPGDVAPSRGVGCTRWPIRVEFSALLDTRRKRPLLRLLRPLVHRGAYRGHLLAHRLPLLCDRDRRALHEDGWVHDLKEAARVAAEHLLSHGYAGPASLDLAWVDTSEGPAIALFEINPRWTMGHVATRIASHVSPRSTAAWVHLPPGPSLLDFAQRHPVQRDRQDRWMRGAWFPTDAWTAKRRATVAVATTDEHELASWLEQLGIPVQRGPGET